MIRDYKILPKEHIKFLGFGFPMVIFCDQVDNAKNDVEICIPITQLRNVPFLQGILDSKRMEAKRAWDWFTDFGGFLAKIYLQQAFGYLHYGLKFLYW
jgi:hypothetical protein